MAKMKQKAQDQPGRVHGLDLRGGAHNQRVVNPAQLLASMAIKISACYIKMTHVLRVRDEWKGAEGHGVSSQHKT